MNENKIFKMNDDALQNVTGGQGVSMPMCDDTMTAPDLPSKWDDPNLVYLCCPECGGSLGVSTYKSDDHSTTMTIVCPHCNKTISVTV